MSGFSYRKLKRAFIVLLAFLSCLIGGQAYAQKTCKEVINSEVTVKMHGVEFRFSGSEKNPAEIKKSLTSLFKMMSADESPVNKSIQGQKITELRSKYVGGEDSFYKKIRETRKLSESHRGNKESKRKKTSISRKKIIGVEEIKLARQHGFTVWQVMALSDGRLVSAAGDRKVIVWKQQGDSYEKDFELGEFTRDVFKILELKDGSLFVIPEGLPVHVYRKKGQSYKFIKELEVAMPRASLFQLKDRRIAQIVNRTVGAKNWEPQGELLKDIVQLQLYGRKGASVLELSNGRFLVSSPEDQAVYILSKDGSSHEVVGEFISGPRKAIELSDGRLVVLFDGHLRVFEYNAQSGSYDVKEPAHFETDDIFPIIALNNGRFALGLPGGRVGVFELAGDGYKQLFVSEGRTSFIASFTLLSDGRLAVGYSDGVIQILEFKYLEEEL